MDTNAQCVSAGDSTLTYYSDINPDAYLLSCCYQPPDTFYLDLNGDTHTDFYIVTWYMNYSMGTSGYSFIQGTGTNKILANSTNDSIPDTLDINNSICETGVWKNKAFFTQYSYFVSNPGSAFYHFEWGGLNKYVGLKIVQPADSTFGWVELKINGSVGYSSAFVKRYGCGDIAPYTLPTPEGVIICPNPTNDIATINLPGYIKTELYNDKGQIIYKNEGIQKIIDLSAFPSGIYILKIVSGTSVFSEKIIKIRDKK